MDAGLYEGSSFKRKTRGCDSRNDEYESRSSTDNLDGGSGEDQDADNQLRRKRYHRHTPRQIQEMEELFKEFPHPDENQRQELSKRLCLEPRQVKFWFQNRRTQMKNQQERTENSILRQENDRLRSEIIAIREAVRNALCPNCGGSPLFNDMSSEDQQQRVRNARFKNELERVADFVEKSLGRSISALPPNSSLHLAVGSNSFDRLHPTLASGMEFAEGIRSRRLMNIERETVAELAVKAMDELMRMATVHENLWLPSCNDQGMKEVLNYEEYLNQFSMAPRIGPKPFGYSTDATRETAMVVIDSLNLVETLMDVDRWTEMFPCIISKAATLDVISGGVDGTLNGALQLMYAELQVLSPLVPTREVHFLRFCKQHRDGLWAVVDVSVDCVHENLPASSIRCRRQPSGCVIEDMTNGYSKVTWVEHSEYDGVEVHGLYRPVLERGMAFGAQRWVATLQRQIERRAVMVAPQDVPTVDNLALTTPDGRCSMLKLAERMTVGFCAGVSASSVHTWTKLTDHSDDNVRITTRKSIDDPGEPPGTVLNAATSVWLPVSPKRLFEFLRDEKLRSQWDILSNGSPMQVVVHVAKGQDPGNSVSLLKVANGNLSGMLILQESSTDVSGSIIVYAPVDLPAMHSVMTGGDSTYVALLPSGFAILPNVPETGPSAIHLDKDTHHREHVGGSLLTVAFQILVNNLPTAKLTMESVETVNNLISCTVQKIKLALDCKDT